MQYRNGRAILVGVVSHGSFKHEKDLPKEGDDVSIDDYDIFYPKVYLFRDWIRRHARF